MNAFGSCNNIIDKAQHSNIQTFKHSNIQGNKTVAPLNTGHTSKVTNNIEHNYVTYNFMKLK
ncbi:MAG: hypothetical protein ACI93R_002910, partial [Flavobacteriales bacterium]